MKNVDQAARRLAHTQIEKHSSIDSLKPITAMKKERERANKSPQPTGISSLISHQTRSNRAGGWARRSACLNGLGAKWCRWVAGRYPAATHSR